MKNLIYLAAGLLLLLSAGACKDKHGKNYNQQVQNEQDGLNFIKGGIEGDLTEIKASGLAIVNSRNQRVIRLAKTVIEDHTAFGDGLDKLKNDKKLTATDTISAQHQQMLADLSKKSGRVFDKAYLQMMVTDHEEAVKLFTAASQNTDTAISKFASRTLPTIKTHLDSANAICITLK